jgi:hypothetical protein
MQRRRLNAARNAGLLATVPAPRVNHERELIARPGPVGDETLTQRDQLSLAIVPQPGDRNLGGRRDVEAWSDFLEEECELEELGENLCFGPGISATHRAPILAASLLHHCI